MKAYAAGELGLPAELKNQILSQLRTINQDSWTSIIFPLPLKARAATLLNSFGKQ